MSSAPRRILYVHHRPELGGSPQSLFYLLSALDRTRFEPHVYCPPGPAAELFRTAGAEVHTGPVAGFTHIWASTYVGRRWLLLGRELGRLAQHLIALRRVLAEGDFDIVHLNDSPLLPAALLIHKLEIPIVWHLRSALPPAGRRSQFVRSLIRHYAAAAIAISEDVAGSFQLPAFVVPNAVDLERFRPDDVKAAKRSLGLSVDVPVISFFGFIYPLKGYRDFIEAAAILRSRGVVAYFLVVGGDVRGEYFFEGWIGKFLKALGLARNYEVEAHELVDALGLQELVRFVPFTSETVSFYQASDIVVAPSRGPELGRPVTEAAACGRAVVASGSLGGAGLLLPRETGYLIPRRSPNMIATALEILITNTELQAEFGVNARRHAERTFDTDRNASRVMEIYDDVLARA